MVSWDTIGRKIKGIFEGATEEQTQYGPRVRYLVRGETRTYSLPGTTHLNRYMRPVQIHDLIEIAYTKDVELPGGRSMKFFEVGIDDGTG